MCAARTFDRASLIAALERIGREAVAHGTRLEMLIYGGSALMLASNFRFATEDVHVAELPKPWPSWLSQVVAGIAEENGWSPDWLNEAVQVHLSSEASRSADHFEFRLFPADAEDAGLSVYVPSAEYMLALKLKAMRITDPVKGPQEGDDILHLMRVLGLSTADEALGLLARYFPISGASPEKQRFLLRHLRLSPTAERIDAPTYGR